MNLFHARSIPAVLFLCFLSAAPVLADEYTFIGTSPQGDWFVPENWSADEVPATNFSDVFIGGTPGSNSVRFSDAIIELRDLTINGGELTIDNGELSADTQFGSSGTNRLIITNNGVLHEGGGINIGANTLIMLGTGGDHGTLNASTIHSLAGSSIVADFSDFSSFDVRMFGEISVHKLGAGTLALSQYNDAAGSLTIDGGSVQLGVWDSAHNFTVAINSPGGLSFGAGVTDATVVGLSGNGGFVLQTIDEEAVSLTFGNGFSGTYGGEISGGGSLIKVGTGTITLSGASSYTGGTEINAGTVRVSADANLGDTSSILTLDSSTLATTASFTSARAISLQTAHLQVQAGTTLTLTGQISAAADTEDDAALILEGGGAVVLTGTYAAYGHTMISSSTLVVRDGGAMESQITLGTGGSGTSVLRVENGGSLTSGKVFVGYDSVAEMVVTGEGSSWTGQADLFAVGYHADGFLSILDGAEVNLSVGQVYVMEIGSHLARGTLLISDEGSSFIADGLLLRGGSAFTVQDRAYAHVMSDFEIGNAAVAVTGSAHLEIDGSLAVGSGAGGRGTFEITDATVTARELRVGGGAGSIASLTIDGTNSALSVTDPVSIGGVGSGTLTIRNGGRLDVLGDSGFENYIGELGGSNGTVILTGEGSTWDLHGNSLTIGSDGTGYVSVGEGASLSVGSFGLYLGMGGGSSGTVEQTGGTVHLSELYFGAGQANYQLEGGVLRVDNRILGNPGYNGFELAGGTLQAGTEFFVMEGAATLRAGTTSTLDNNGFNLNLDASFSGSGGLAFGGTGSFVLLNAHTYTGGTTLREGTLQIGNNDMTASVAGDIENDGSLIFMRFDDYSFGGNISGTGSVTQAAFSTLILSGSNSFTGGLRVNDDARVSVSAARNLGAGTVFLENSTLQTSESFASNHAIVLTNGTLEVDDEKTTTLNGTISGSELTKIGLGTLVLNGTNTYDGGTRLWGGTLSISSSDNIGGSLFQLDINNGTLETTASLSLDGNDVSLGFDGGTIKVNASQTTSIGSAIVGEGGLKKSGAGTLVLSAENSYFGDTTIQEGALAISANENLGDEASTLVLNGGALQTTTSFTIDRYIGLGGGAFQVDTGVTTTVAGYVFGTGLIKRGLGTLALDGANGYIDTTIEEGVLSIFDDSNLGDNSGHLTLAGGTLRTTESFTISQAITVGGGAFEVDAGRTTTLAGVIDGTVLTKSGEGTLLLSTANLYTGGTILNEGTLEIGANDAIGAGRLTINGGVLRAGGAERDMENEITMAGDFTLGRSTNLLGAITLADDITITSANPDATGPSTTRISGAISGTHALTFTEDANPIGAIILSGSNSYTGGTTIQAGTLLVSGSSVFGTGSVNVESGTLFVTRTWSVTNTVSLAGGTYARELDGGENLANAINSTGNFAGGAPDTTATLLGGVASDGAVLQSRFSNTSGALNDTVRLSDIYSLSGVPVVDPETGETDIFVLQLSMTNVGPDTYLGWLNDSNEWVNAINGNFDNSAEGQQLGFNGSFSLFQLTYGDTLSEYVGAWGRTSNGVWAVLNHNSDFAAVPEPSTWALIGIGLTSLLAFRKRRRA